MAAASIDSLWKIDPIGRIKDMGMGFLNGTKAAIVNTFTGVVDAAKLIKNKALNTVTPYIEGILAFAPWRKSYAPQIIETLKGRAK